MFIDLLTDILATLASKANSNGSNKDGKDRTSATGDTPGKANVTNYFSSLSLLQEEAIEDDQTAEPSTATRPSNPEITETSIPEATYDLEVESGSEYAQEDMLFATYCLFEDLSQFRRLLKAVWRQYLIGNCDLTPISVLTNTIIDMARREEDRSNREHPAYKGFEETVRVILGPQYHTTNMDVFPKNPLFTTTYTILKSYLLTTSSAPDQISYLVREPVGTYDPLSNRHDKTDLEKAKEDKIILGEILEEFGLLGYCPVELPVQDELTRGLRDMFTTKNSPRIWLVFAAQVFLDIHHIMRNKVSCSFDEVQNAAKQTFEILSKKRQFIKLLNLTSSQRPSWSEWLDHKCEQLMFTIDHWIFEDALFLTRSGSKDWDGSPLPPGEPFYLFRRHPLFCGTLSFHVTFSMAQFGLDLAEEAGLLKVIHLYNALAAKDRDFFRPQTEKHAMEKDKEDDTGKEGNEIPVDDGNEQDGKEYQEDSMVWPDMELVISILTEKKLFVGGAPTTLLDCYHRLFLAMGASVTVFAANNKKGNRQVDCRKSFRPLNDLPHMLNLLHPPYIAGQPLRDSTRKVEEHYHSRRMEINRRTSSRLRGQSKHARDSGAWEYDRFLYIGEFLSELVLHEAWLRFDWLTFHTNCRTFLVSLKPRFWRLVSAEAASGPFSPEDVLPFLCTRIILKATESEQWAENAKRKKKMKGAAAAAEIAGGSGSENDDVLPQAREVLRTFVKKWGAGGVTDWVNKLGYSQQAEIAIEHFSAEGLSFAESVERMRDIWFERVGERE